MVLAAVVFGSLPFVLLRPQVGVLMYVWISVMNPHRFVWGFGNDLGLAAILAGATLIGALFSKDLKRPPMNVSGLT